MHRIKNSNARVKPRKECEIMKRAPVTLCCDYVKMSGYISAGPEKVYKL